MTQATILTGSHVIARGELVATPDWAPVRRPPLYQLEMALQASIRIGNKIRTGQVIPLEIRKDAPCQNN